MPDNDLDDSEHSETSEGGQGAAVLTIPEAGQRLQITSAQMVRLIALGEVRAAKDARGWWRVDAASVDAYRQRQGEPGAPNSSTQAAS